MTFLQGPEFEHYFNLIKRHANASFKQMSSDFLFCFLFLSQSTFPNLEMVYCDRSPSIKDDPLIWLCGWIHWPDITLPNIMVLSNIWNACRIYTQTPTSCFWDSIIRFSFLFNWWVFVCEWVSERERETLYRTDQKYPRYLLASIGNQWELHQFVAYVFFTLFVSHTVLLIYAILTHTQKAA